MWDVVDEDEMRFAGSRENKCRRSEIMPERVMSRVVGMEHVKQVVVSCLSPISLSSKTCIAVLPPCHRPSVYLMSAQPLEQLLHYQTSSLTLLP